jgi:hypothetical protein
MRYCIVGWVGPNSTKDHGAFIFRRPSSLPGLLARHEGTVILWNIRNHPPTGTLAHARRHCLWEPHIARCSVAWNNSNDNIRNIKASKKITKSLCNKQKKKKKSVKYLSCNLLSTADTQFWVTLAWSIHESLKFNISLCSLTAICHLWRIYFTS